MNIFVRLTFLAIFFVCSIKYTFAQVTVFENNQSGWINEVGVKTIVTIDFDSIPGSVTEPIIGDEFSANPDNPIITLVEGTGIFVGNPASDQIPNPPSGDNMLGPTNSGSIEGILRISFSQPIHAIGATFVDVEADFNTTGFSLDIGSQLPGISFSGTQGQASFSFLGFVSKNSFTSVEIHFATGSNIDGILIDDLVYSSSVLIFKDDFEIISAK